jgi:hypothetical protein
MQYAVKDNYTFWFKALEDKDLPLRTCVTRKVPKFFSYDDWDGFNFFPQNKTTGSLLVPKSKIPRCHVEGLLSEPFGGGTPTALQAGTFSARLQKGGDRKPRVVFGRRLTPIFLPLFTAALVGSTVFSENTSRAPSAFAAYTSTRAGANANSSSLSELSLVAQANLIWKLFDSKVDFGLCTQTKNCGIHDALFSHANIIDQGSLGLTLGQHHAIDKADQSKTLKIIYTVHTFLNGGSFLLYFNTTDNKGIPPGGYIWPNQSNGETTPSPWASMQIFENFLDQAMLDSMLVRVPNTFVRTARMALTTVANPKLHVDAGQKVDMLVLVISSDLPLIPVPVGPIDGTFSAEVSRSTAASAELVAIVKEFAET